MECADALERMLTEKGSHDVAAFIFEPVVGATLGAVAPPPGYVERIAEICKRNGILLIADEVMTGMGRTGKPFAIEHEGVVPDMILVGKGIASGYAPLGAVIVSGDVAGAIAEGSGTFLHGYTYNGHPVAAAAANAVLDYIERERLFERVEPVGARALRRTLDALTKIFGGRRRARTRIAARHRVGERRGRSANRFRRMRASRPAWLADAAEAGVMTYPIQGCVDGARGDHILIAPPFTINSQMIGMLVEGVEARCGGSRPAASGADGRLHCAQLSGIGALRCCVAAALAAGGVCLRRAARRLPGRPRKCSGFLRRRDAEKQASIEEQYRKLTSPEQISKFHRYLTSEPHPAGSKRNNELAQWVAQQWRDQGLEDVTVHEYDVLNSRPRKISLEMTKPSHFKASLREAPYNVDPDTKIRRPMERIWDIRRRAK